MADQHSAREVWPSFRAAVGNRPMIIDVGTAPVPAIWCVLFRLLACLCQLTVSRPGR